ncbi:hypothetical protein D3C72_810240 [compost metagenome]
MQRLQRCRELRLAETGIGDLDIFLEGSERQNIGDDDTFDRLVGPEPRGADPRQPNADPRIDQHGGLPCGGGGFAEIGIGRLKALVVQERNLHRRLDIKGLAGCHQRFDAGLRRLRLGPVLHPDRLLACCFGCSGRNIGETGVARRILGGCDAAAEKKRQAKGGREFSAELECA